MVLLCTHTVRAQRFTVDDVALQAQGGKLILSSSPFSQPYRLTLPSTTGTVGDAMIVTSYSGSTVELGWSASSAWNISGNATTTSWNGAGGSFIGTTGGQPLAIATTHTIAQPIRMYTGPSGTLASFEVGAYGDISAPVRVGIGPGVGAASLERLRIGVVPESGTAQVIDLVGTTQATGLRVQRIGASGSEHAGIVLSASANGLGTGLRFGGPSGAGRPSLGTAIDITGGTGLRYTALSPGVGTALEIGSTTSPLRGVDVTASGTEHIGGIFRSNLNGAGVVGISASAAYAEPLHIPRVGVRGFAASNGTAILDTIIGVLGHVVRGGSGGTNTTSYGVSGIAEHVGTSHAGLAIGIAGTAAAVAPGTSGSIAGLFRSTAGANNLALAVSGGGNVYLGSTDEDRPAGFPTSFRAGINAGNLNTTYMHHARVSGDLMVRGASGSVTSIRGAAGTAQTTLILPAQPPQVGDRLSVTTTSGSIAALQWSNALSVREGAAVIIPAGVAQVVTPSDEGHVSCTGLGAGAAIVGITGGSNGRIVILTMPVGEVVLANESPVAAPNERIITMTGGDAVVMGDGAVVLWYQQSRQRWLVISLQP
jgi:hypothetical protein